MTEPQPKEMHWIARNTLKILFFLFLLFMLYMGFQDVYSQPQLKYYSIPNQTDCITNIHPLLNNTYMRNIRQILLFQKDNGVFQGQFYPNYIYVFGGCDDAYLTVFHELIHQCQWERKDKWNNMVYHKGLWEDCVGRVYFQEEWKNVRTPFE